MTRHMINLRADRRALDDLMPLGRVVRVHPDGTVEHTDDVDAPELTTGTDPYGQILREHTDKLIADAEELGWELQTGWSGQNSGYHSDPTMHASEFIGGHVAHMILDTPGLWVAIEQATSDGATPEGWLLMHRTDPSLPVLPELEFPAAIRRPYDSSRVPLTGRTLAVDYRADRFAVQWSNDSLSLESLDDRNLVWLAASAEKFTAPAPPAPAPVLWLPGIVVGRRVLTAQDQATGAPQMPGVIVEVSHAAPLMKVAWYSGAEQTLKQGDMGVTWVFAPADAAPDPDDEDEDEDEAGCQGHADTDHNLLSGAGIGETTYCDGSCNPPRTRTTDKEK